MENNEQKQKRLPYRIVCGGGQGEIEEKKSRFIATVAPVESEEEATAFIESVKKKYYDARHNCPAFIIGRNKELTRCSDDGEPSGTAGKPILEVLLGAGLTNVAVVVTRYFGGTLLGTGGLVRAYTQAAQAGIAACKTATMRYGATIRIETDYTDLGKIQHLLGNKEIPIISSDYTDKVSLMVQIPEEKADALIKELTESTAARAVMEITEKGYYREDEK
ncbi:MAG: YigZ family protein [Lachnospiraceae bacterium]|nr:YigZ family protein [Lachnospiraceae bacterium]